MKVDDLSKEQLIELIQKLRISIPAKIAEEICSVQPMSNIDFEALAQHPLWISYCNRHHKE